MTCCVLQIFAEASDIDFSKPEWKPNNLLTMAWFVPQGSYRVRFSAAEFAVNVASLGRSLPNRIAQLVPRSWVLCLPFYQRTQSSVGKWPNLELELGACKTIAIRKICSARKQRSAQKARQQVMSSEHQSHWSSQQPRQEYEQHNKTALIITQA